MFALVKGRLSSASFSKGGIFIFKKGLFFLFVAFIVLGTLLYINSQPSLPINEKNYERSEYIHYPDFPLGDIVRLSGKNVIHGGPYQEGDIVIVDSIAVELNKVGWNPKMLESETPTTLKGRGF